MIADFMKEVKGDGTNGQQSHQSQVTQSNLINVHEP